MSMGMGAELVLCSPGHDVPSAEPGDVALIGDERVLVLQVARTRLEYVGMVGPTWRLALLVRPVAGLLIE